MPLITIVLYNYVDISYTLRQNKKKNTTIKTIETIDLLLKM